MGLMKDRHWMRVTAAVALLVTAAVARGDCVATAKPVTSPSVFPSRVPGPVATNGPILGVAKTDADSSTNAIFFAIYDSSLNPITDDRQLVDRSLNGAAALFWTGSEFGLFYQSPGLLLTLQRFDASGNFIGAPISIANHPWSPNDEFDIAWAPARNGYAIARTVTGAVDRGLWLTIVSPTGTVLSDTNLSLFINPGAMPRVVALADGTVDLVWSRSGDTPVLVLTVVPQSGTAKSTIVTNRNVTSVRVASDGTSILIIVSSTTSTSGTELRYARYDPAGSVLTADAALMSGTGIDIAPLSLVWNPTLSEFALVYVDAPVGLTLFGDTRLRRFTSPTAPASDTLFSPDPLHSRLRAPFPIVFMSGGYVGSIQQVLSRIEGSESYLVRHCPFFVTASADHPIWHPFVPITFTATPSGGTPGYTYLWDFGDLSQQTGAVVQHAYLLTGTYTVTLTGTDAAGARSITKLTVQVAPTRQRAVRH